MSVRLLCARLWSLSCGNWRPSRHCSRWISSRHSCPTPSSSAEVITTTFSVSLSHFHPPSHHPLFILIRPPYPPRLPILLSLSMPLLPSPPLPLSRPPLCSETHISVNTGDYDAIQVLMLLPRIIFKADLVTDQLKQQVCTCITQ